MMMRIHTEKLSTEDPVFNSQNLSVRENTTQAWDGPGRKPEPWVTDLHTKQSRCKWYRKPGAVRGKGADRNKTQESRLQRRVKIQAYKGNVMRMRNPGKRKWGRHGEHWIIRLQQEANVPRAAGAAFKPNTRNVCFKLFPDPTHWWEHSPWGPASPTHQWFKEQAGVQL